MRRLEVTLSFPGERRVDARFDEFVVPSDQPVTVGGGGTAPAPLDAFIASIANCAGYFVMRFLDRRDIDRAGLAVRLVAEPDEETHLYRKIRVEITPPAGFPEKYRRALVAAAEQCSVKKHLLQPPEFTTTLVERREDGPRLRRNEEFGDRAD